LHNIALYKFPILIYSILFSIVVVVVVVVVAPSSSSVESSDENKVIRIAKCDALSGPCESIP